MVHLLGLGGNRQTSETYQSHEPTPVLLFHFFSFVRLGVIADKRRFGPVFLGGVVYFLLQQSSSKRVQKWDTPRREKLQDRRQKTS
jgi:hypothetical protein